MRKPVLSLFPAIAVAATVLSAACLILPDVGESDGWRTVPGRQKTAVTGKEFRRTLDLRAGGTLSLENDYGNVEITGWDRDSVEVVARSAAVERQRQRSAREYSDRDLAPEVEILERSGGLLVRTPTFEGPGRPPAVDFKVRVPNSIDLTGIRISEGNLDISDVFGRLEVSVDQGDLLVSNYSGPVRATVATGNADIEVLDLREGDEITITARRGDIILRLESGAGAIVEADAPRGEVVSDFDLGKKLPASAVKGWIGQGGPNVILRASEGRIEIVKIADGPTAAPAAQGK